MTPIEGLREIKEALQWGAVIRADVEALLEFAEATLERWPEPQYGMDAIRNGVEYERREARWKAALEALCISRSGKAAE